MYTFIRTATLIFTVLLGATAALAAQRSFPDIEQLMSADEFRNTGLHRLSEAEREALNRWLVTYTAEEAPEMLRSNPEVRAAESAIRIEATIKTPFDGWSGKTVFYLDNGQVWQQRLSGRYFHRGDNRAVVIEKNLLGFFKMTMTSSGKTVGVTRLR
ncbi:hypothetical protein CWI75_04060 [Kineobactrum sediminis]|uniref:Uncharacterized protein n=1 Tax=Kineobactrum sediminis TaxID=1905677 RepID=A0A2N5Y559_9GAMM|nr:hypothetical protein [Kineobactrum sediminis]PLW83536.1 hypothetical protein CWI75_04060 [Kineobactrum sediminis]